MVENCPHCGSPVDKKRMEEEEIIRAMLKSEEVVHTVWTCGSRQYDAPDFFVMECRLRKAERWIENHRGCGHGSPM